MPAKGKSTGSKITKRASKSNGKKQPAEQPKAAYFLSLTVENVRCFGSPAQTLDLSDGNGNPKQWTIILGDNGTGKTTLLRTIISVSPVVEREGNKMGVTIQYRFPIHRLWTFEPHNNRFVVDALFSSTSSLINIGEVFGLKIWGTVAGIYWDCSRKYYAETVICFGYGASRKEGETSLSDNKRESIYKTLFDETALLINPEEWLLQADYAASRNSEFKEKRKHQLELVKRILIDILPDVDDIRFSETESGRTPKPIVEFHTPYGWVESKDLSLGYRTSMAWVVDFASRMFERYPDSENPLEEPAVVLIDEIDLHLHPKWQRDLIDYLTNLFPNTQFIVTTHSPLIVQAAAARDANIVVCRREGDHVVIDQSIEAVRGWRADQILTSDLFDLPSARPKETEELLEQRKRILSKAKLTRADKKKLDEIAEKLGSLPVMENPEDDKAMDIIRRAAARLQQENPDLSRHDSHQ